MNENNYKICKNESFLKGPFLALNAHSPLNFVSLILHLT